MGSPLDPVIANNFVGFCESSIPPSLWPPMYCRFVDDHVYCHDKDEKTCQQFLSGTEIYIRRGREWHNIFPGSFSDANIKR